MTTRRSETTTGRGEKTMRMDDNGSEGATTRTRATTTGTGTMRTAVGMTVGTRRRATGKTLAHTHKHVHARRVACAHQHFIISPGENLGVFLFGRIRVVTVVFITRRFYHTQIDFCGTV